MIGPHQGVGVGPRAQQQPHPRGLALAGRLPQLPPQLGLLLGGGGRGAAPVHQVLQPDV